MSRLRAAGLAGLLGLLAATTAAADEIETSGHVLRVAIPLYAYGVAWQREDGDGQRQWLYSMGATVVTTLALKAAIDKERPGGGDDDAFPSGHAATAFAGAGFLHRRYGLADAWPAYLLAGWVGYTRVHDDEHEWEDVLGGAAVGLASNWLLVEPWEGARVTPTVDEDVVGLRIEARW